MVVLVENDMQGNMFGHHHLRVLNLELRFDWKESLARREETMDCIGARM